MDWIDQIPLMLLIDPIPTSFPPPTGSSKAPQGAFLMALRRRRAPFSWQRQKPDPIRKLELSREVKAGCENGK